MANPVPLQDVVYNYMPAQVVHVAARLDIADRLAGGPRTLVELAEETGAHPPSLRRLLRALLCLDVVAEPEPDRFELAPRGQELRADTPNSIKSSVLWFCSEEMWRTWGELEYTVRTGRNAWEHLFGMNPFRYLEGRPDAFGTFNAAMADRTRAVAPRITAAYDFSRFDRLVDVGGGNGQLLALLLAGVPGLRGLVYDYPAAVAAAGPVLREHGVADRCAVAAGNFFESVPEGESAYLLKSILHDWADEECAAILRAVRAAIPAEGTLLVVDRVLPAAVTAEDRRAVISDINVLVATSGKERTEAEFRALFAATGFALVEVVPTGADPAGYHVVVGEPV